MPYTHVMSRKSHHQSVETLEPNTKTVKMSPEWVAEINRRIDDLESGRVKGIPAEEVYAEIERKYGYKLRY